MTREMMMNMQDNYHQKAQKYINSAKKMGMTVKAEGEEIIATPRKRISRQKSDQQQTPLKPENMGFKSPVDEGAKAGKMSKRINLIRKKK